MKSRMYPCFRPQRKHRRTTRDLNFGGLSALAITDFLAMFNGNRPIGAVLHSSRKIALTSNLA